MTLASIAPVPEIEYRAYDISDLPGFDQDTLEQAAQAWQHSCQFLLNLVPPQVFPLNVPLDLWQKVANDFLNSPPSSFKSYLSNTFKAYEINPKEKEPALFTGYFEPQLQGSRQFSEAYPYPVYGKPSDLIVIEDLGLFRPALAGHRIAGFIQQGTLIPGPTRDQIEEGCLKEQRLEICWVADQVDLYFMHVQGCGEILFPDRTSTRLCYAGTNGHAYCSLGQEMIHQGLLSPDSSLAEMKRILKENLPRAQALFHCNPSYVFFKEDPEARGPKGCLGSALTPFRSLAVDPRVVPLGLPLWINTAPITGFMTAQDVGGAIKGTRRGDIFCGTGAQAGIQAGALNHEGRLFILIPQGHNQR